MRRAMILATGIVAVILAASPVAAAPSPADVGWEDVEVLPDDGTWCEFEPGVLTEYQVDASTLPRYDRVLVIFRERFDGQLWANQVFQRNGVEMLKLDAADPGPDVIVKSGRWNIVGTYGQDEQPIDVNLSGVFVTRTQDGDLIDHNNLRVRWDDAAVVTWRSTGVCQP